METSKTKEQAPIENTQPKPQKKEFKDAGQDQIPTQAQVGIDDQ